MGRKQDVKKYYSSRSALQVLGSLMINPSWVESVEKPIEVEDFIGSEHRDLFKVIYNLNLQGINTIGLADVENYLHETSPVTYAKLFEKSNGQDWISKALMDANPDNYDEYYNRVRKYALLRSYISEGVDVTGILDLDDLELVGDEKQKKYFDSLSIDDIIEYFDRQNRKSKERFIVRGHGNSRKSGDGDETLIDIIRQTPPVGYGFESEYFNTVSRGIQGNRLIIDTRDSGCYKTRTAISRIVKLCSPYLWNIKKKCWEENPNGKGHSALYIGTELDLYLEIEPMILCFIAGVEEDKFRAKLTTPEEDERIIQAMEYSKQANIFLEDEADFNIRFLRQIIEKYNSQYNLDLVCLDYIELNGALIREFVEISHGMTAREDMILLNLSKELKQMAKDFDLTIVAFTQASSEGRKEGFRDQSVIKGGKSLPNKSDLGYTVFAPTPKEMKILEPIIMEKSKGFGKKLIPNMGITIYKNRWFNFRDEQGREIKELKIWLRFDGGTGRCVDCFTTTKNYELINLPKTKVDVNAED